MSRLKQSAVGLVRGILPTASFAIAAWAGPADANESWMTTATHAFPLQQSDVVHCASENETISVVVVLRTRSPDTLAREIQRNGGLGSRSKKLSQSIIPFLPTAEQAKIVSDYLLQSGFRDVKVSDDRLLVSAAGSSSTVRQAFKTAIVDVNRNGAVGIANVSDVQLPAEVAPLVISVLGLQTLVHPHTMFVPSVSPQSTSATFSPTAFPSVYGASSLPSATRTTIGIIADGVLTQVLEAVS